MAQDPNFNETNSRERRRRGSTAGASRTQVKKPKTMGGSYHYFIKKMCANEYERHTGEAANDAQLNALCETTTRDGLRKYLVETDETKSPVNLERRVKAKPSEDISDKKPGPSRST